ncbi:MAG: aldehyde ferredoxin oxidoreductase family protein [Proteobacteria bacterium]|nr:aldehyde ferredoxin oxidoreductase family protein [Pseudomonadota bacterium]
MYLERILFVDLTQSRSWTTKKETGYLKQYLGGVGLGTRLLYDHLPAGADPLEPENVVVFAPGVFAGTPVATGAKHAVVAKSPLTGMIGDSLSGSFWSHTLRRAGYDALIITGSADNLVYLSIYDDQVQIRSARHLAGMSTFDTENQLRAELGSDEVSVSAIGPAGERMVRFAAIANDQGRMAGRTGMGAVMGSKNLKAIAVRGSNTLRVADIDALWPMTIDLAQRCQGPMTHKYRIHGTPSNVDYLNHLGAIPTRNFRETTFEGADKINGESINRHYLERIVACSGCPVGCEHIMLVREGPYSGARTRMDYEPLYSMSSLWGVDDLSVAIRATEIAGQMGMDAVSAGTTVAWAMECFERGILTKNDFDGLEPYFGNGAAAVTLLEQIAKREGVGDLLAEGTKRAAEQVGQDSLDFAMQVKGMEMAGYDPRSLKTMGLSYAVGTRGACHNRSPGYSPDTQGTVDRFKGGPERGPILTELEDKAAVLDSLVICKFIRGVFADFYSEASQLFEATVGQEMTPEMLALAGERINNLKKAFNIREGWTSGDDRLPARALREAMPSGPGQGVHMHEEELQTMITSYYAARGWTEDGLIPADKLNALGMEDVANDVGIKNGQGVV